MARASLAVAHSKTWLETSPRLEMRLVLEAGHSARDAVTAQISAFFFLFFLEVCFSRTRLDSLGGTYCDSLLGASYDYAYRTVPQTNVGPMMLTWLRVGLGGKGMSNPSFFLPSVRLPGLNASIGLFRRQRDVHRPSKRNPSQRKEQAHLGRYLDMGQRLLSAAWMHFKTSSRGSDGPLQAIYPA